MKTQLKLFFEQGMQLEDAYSIEEKFEWKVQYVDSKEVEAAVLKKYPQPINSINFLDSGEEIIQEPARKNAYLKQKKKLVTISFFAISSFDLI